MLETDRSIDTEREIDREIEIEGEKQRKGIETYRYYVIDRLNSACIYYVVVHPTPNV